MFHLVFPSSFPIDKAFKSLLGVFFSLLRHPSCISFFFFCPFFKGNRFFSQCAYTLPYFAETCSVVHPPAFPSILNRSLFLNNHRLSHTRKPLSIRPPKARPPYHSQRSSCFCSFPDPLPNVRIHLTLHIFRARKTSKPTKVSRRRRCVCLSKQSIGVRSPRTTPSIKGG